METRTRNVLALSVGFFLLFFAFNTTQNFETTLNADLGYWSLSLVYLFFSTSNVVSSRVVQILGDRTALLLGGALYLVFIAANIYPIAPVLLPASALLGFGAAVIWTAQGAIVAKNSDEATLGKNNGTFWSIFMCNAVFGNLFAAAVLPHLGGVEYILFVLLCGFGVIGCCCFCLVTRAPVLLHTAGGVQEVELPAPSDGDGGDKGREEAGAAPRESSAARESAASKQGVLATLRMFRDERMLLLAAIMSYSGTSQSFIYGKFPPLFGKELLGWGMATFGVCAVSSAVLGGRISDRLGRRPVLAAAAAMHVLAYSGVVLQRSFLADAKWPLFVVAGCLGVGDAGWNTQLNAIVGSFHPVASEPAFGYFKLLQATSSALAFAYGRYIAVEVFAGLLMALLTAGVFHMVLLHVHVAPVERAVAAPTAAAAARTAA